MDNQECDEVFDQLVTQLKSFKLEWLVQAVQAQIEEGIETTSAVETFEEIHDPKGGRPTIKSSGKMMATTITKVDSKVKLHYLIDAIESVVVETAFMVSDTISELNYGSVFRSKPIVLQFRSPVDGRLTHEVKMQSKQDRVSSVTRLKKHLDQLRSEI